MLIKIYIQLITYIHTHSLNKKRNYDVLHLSKYFPVEFCQILKVKLIIALIITTLHRLNYFYEL